MNKSIFLSFLLSVLFGFNNMATSQQLPAPVNTDRNGKISGKILDKNGASIILPQPQIQFESSSFQKTISVDEEGMYVVNLPTGTYNIKLNIKGYQPLMRSLIKVEANKVYSLNLVPTPIYLTLGTSLYASENVDQMAVSAKYETLFQNSCNAPR